VVVNAHDVTEREARERQLRRQNERLDTFASVASHDLRNPLNVADGYLDLAREDATGETPHLDRADDAHDRLGDILDDVLALAQNGGDVGETAPSSIRSVAIDAWENVATGGATLAVTREPTVEADRPRLLRLFENLLRNSVEHGSTDDPPDSGTSPERSTDGEEAGTDGVAATVGALPDDDGFDVEDDGPGVPPEARDRAFESGYTTDGDGTGIGLAIVRVVAEGHGLTLSLPAGSGGARFEFRTGADAPAGSRGEREESGGDPAGIGSAGSSRTE
jgi:signal transduction histidine kinase